MKIIRTTLHRRKSDRPHNFMAGHPGRVVVTANMPALTMNCPETDDLSEPAALRRKTTRYCMRNRLKNAVGVHNRVACHPKQTGRFTDADKMVRDLPTCTEFRLRRVVPGAGIEPATRGFSIRCSTN
jgi:hypothetical protein